ncbi:MAG: aminopeptidase [Candidatus Bathyarchaeota archaeon]|nr:MAG: aminopeptidase [Candidatus Bathyarchaeota archaeon]
MITKERVMKCAEAIVNGMNLKKEEAVLIRGGSHTQELLEEIGILCYKCGAAPVISATSDSYSARIFDEIPLENLEFTPKHYLGMIKEIDAYIVVEPFQNPQIQTMFPRDKMAARQKANVPIRKALYGEETGKGKKWTYAGWPTTQAARFYGIDYDALEHLIIDGMMVPTSKLKENCAKLTKHLSGKDVLHITDEKGTDFTCHIKGRRINEDDGVVDDHDIAVNDLGNNLPAGELFIAPHETLGEGTIYCPITIDRFSNKLVKDVTLHFRSGKLLLDECTAGTNRDQMIDSFNRCLEIDKKEQNIRTTNIAELGIGCNPAIDKAIGYILTDEKLGGSAHIAFGSNFSYGGTSRSSMHWDFVTHPSATIEVVDTKEVVMKDGAIQ